MAQNNRCADRLLKRLRAHAIKLQRADPRVFLSLRQAATRFNVSVSTVATVYRELEREGLLKRIRGSKTLLQATGSSRQISVNAVVALPMPLSLFMTKQKSRLFFMRLRQALHERGFFPAAVFYNASEAQPEFLRERIAHCNADTVLWYVPDRSARETALLLRDAGVRVLTLADGPQPSPAYRYVIQREKAIAIILRDWKANGEINAVRIVRTPERDQPEEALLKKMLHSHDLAAETVTSPSRQKGVFLDLLSEESGVGIIFTGAAATFFAFRAPERLTGLMLRRRVALVDGPVSLPFAETAAARADLVVANWEEVAAGITSDLLSEKRAQETGSIVFQAEAHLQTPLSRFAQPI